MPEEHLKTLTEGHAAFNRGDRGWASIAAAPDVEWETTGAFPGMNKVYRGPDAIGEWMDVLLVEWESFDVSLEEVLREEENTLVVVERLRGRGRESGAEAEMRVYAVYRFNADGKIYSRKAFTSAEEALAAL